MILMILYRILVHSMALFPVFYPSCLEKQQTVTIVGGKTTKVNIDLQK